MSRIGRTDSMDNRQCFFVPQIFQRLKRRMQAEESIEVNSCFIVASRGICNCQAGSQMILIRVAVRDDRVQTIHAAALKDNPQ